MRLIDADKLTEALYIFLSVDRAYYDEKCDIDFDFVIKTINSQKTVDAVPRELCESMEATCYKLQQALSEANNKRWIPCSERLPEANGRYFVTRGLNACNSLWNRIYIANYSDLMGLKSERIWWNGNVGKSDFERIDDVIAWMPLPPSYKGDIK